MLEEDCVGTGIALVPVLKQYITAGGEGGEWGYVDRRDKEVFDRRFSHAGDFSDGVASVTVSGKAGLIGKDGKFILEPKYASIHPFSEGLAEFSVQTGTKQEDGKEIPVFKQGYLDKQGHVAIEAKFDNAQHFSEGLACVLTGGFMTRHHGFI